MKSKFIKSTIILIIGGLITKILGMVIKIALTRAISAYGIGLYSLILPTFNLFITICSLGLPIAISKLISEGGRNNRRVVLSVIPIMLIFNVVLIIFIVMMAPILSNYFLNNEELYFPIMAIGITLPFICISSIIKGYFFGKEQMVPVMVANVVEQLVRLLLTIFLIPELMIYSLVVAIVGVVLINTVSEFSSIIVLLLFVPKHKKITIHDFKYDRYLFSDLLSISIPTTGSRLIGSVSYFLEPIILTFVLINCEYSNSYITNNYGIINGYVYPLLLLPSFFTLAISSALLPVISNSYNKKRYSYTKNKIRQAIVFSLMIGIPCTILFMTIPDFFLKLIYNTNKGSLFIRIIAPFFLLFYIQGPLTTCMQAMNMAREAMNGTLIGALIKTVLLFFLSYLHIGIWGLLIANIVNIIFVTVHHFYYVYKRL